MLASPFAAGNNSSSSSSYERIFLPLFRTRRTGGTFRHHSKQAWRINSSLNTRLMLCPGECSVDSYSPDPLLPPASDVLSRRCDTHVPANTTVATTANPLHAHATDFVVNIAWALLESRRNKDIETAGPEPRACLPPAIRDKLRVSAEVGRQSEEALLQEC